MSNPTAEQQEADFFKSAAELCAKAATDFAEQSDKFCDTIKSDHLEERPEESPATPTSEDEEEDDAQPARWGSRPTVRAQMERYPNSVKYGPPVTKVLLLHKAEDLAELNRIQAGAYDLEAPNLAVTSMDKQPHEGSWSVLITYSEVLYMPL